MTDREAVVVTPVVAAVASDAASLLAGTPPPADEAWATTVADGMGETAAIPDGVNPNPKIGVAAADSGAPADDPARACPPAKFVS